MNSTILRGSIGMQASSLFAGVLLTVSSRQFERELRYAEKHEQDRVQYDEIRVALRPVIGGNVRTRAISFLLGPAAFRLC